MELCRNNNPKVLIRRRKMPVEDLTYSMINRKGLTLKLELRNYMKITHPGTEISKPEYLKQRMKLNHQAIKFLYQNHNAIDEYPYLVKTDNSISFSGADHSLPIPEEEVPRCITL